MDLDWKGEVWNEEIMCVHRIRDGLTPRIELCIASYYQFLSACGALEEETYSVIDNPRRIARLRNQYASSLDELIRCGLGAHGFGMQVAFVYANQNEKNMILIQRRELAVSIYGGARAVVPMFGCQPHKDRSKVSMSLKHNFLREYYEELYGADEMIRTNQEYLSYSWFYNEEPVSELIRLIDTGEANITILGFGYDALNCECDIAVLVYIANKDFINNQIRTMKRNWEIEKIESVMLFSEELDNMLYNLEFQPGSAFAIAEARKHLLSIGKNQ
ncbi:hypothetical protein JW859_13415 [bacterium]|nr:hypothetical protein [bacterium]